MERRPARAALEESDASRGQRTQVVLTQELNRIQMGKNETN